MAHDLNEDIGELGTVCIFMKEEIDLEDEYFSAENTLIDPLDIPAHPLRNNLHNTKNSPKTKEIVIDDNESCRTVADKVKGAAEASYSNVPFNSNIKINTKKKKFQRNINILKKKNSPKSSNSTSVLKKSIDSLKSTDTTSVSKESTDSPKSTDSALVFKKFTDHFIVLSCVNCMLLVCNIKSYDDSMSPVCLKCHRVMNYRCSICSKDCNDVNYARRHGKFCIEYLARQQNRTTDIELTSSMRKICAIKCIVCNASFPSSSNYLNHIDKKLCSPSVLPKKDKVIIPKRNKQGQKRSIVSERTNGKNRKINYSESIDEEKMMQKCASSAKAKHEIDDSFILVENDPETLIKEIIKIPPKDDWDLENVADWFCLKCNTGSKKPLTRFKPLCQKCLVKCDYRCLKCHKLFGNILNINRHIREECWKPDKRLSIDGLFECSLCKFTSVKRAGLWSHVKHIHAAYKCLKCEIKLQGYKELKKHQKYDCKCRYTQDESDYSLILARCRNCDMSGLPLNQENKDQTTCNKCSTVITYQCSKCWITFESVYLTLKHIEECNPSFCCTNCDHQTFTMSLLCQHLKNNPYCFREYKDEEIFNNHMLEIITSEEFEKNTPGK